MIPKISLIVPVFNVEKYVSKCLDSLVNQTLKDIEIICIDDCSTDNSLQIIEKYASEDSRIKIVKHEVNKGLGQARNTGLCNSCGEYIWFIDSDDYVDIRACQLLYDAAKENDAVIITFQSIAFKIDEQGNEIFSPSYLINDWAKNVNYDLTNHYNLMGNQNVTAWAYIAKRDFIKNFSFRPGVYHEDVDFTLRLFSECKALRNIAYAPYYYRQDNSSITRSKLNQKRLIDNVKTCFSLKSYLDEKKLPRNHFYTDTFINFCVSVQKMIQGFDFTTDIPEEILEFNKMYTKLMICEKRRKSVIDRLIMRIKGLN